MTSVCEQIEIIVRLNSEAASVSRVMVAATTPNVEILACCFSWQGDGAVVRLVTEAPERTVQALVHDGFECETETILLIGPLKRPGATARIGNRLAAAGIGILHSYVSWSERTEAFAIFKTTDENRALRVLRVNASAANLARETSEPVLARLVA
ncbi:MAG TPA: hypothetical protein VL486_03210 [Verrucomicrobiae bacterium]|nr:hypothetical protein [Verrucomicrobiae bacterium]